MAALTAPAPAPAAQTPDRTRRRSMVALFVATAALNTSMVGASTVATLIASEAKGDAWSGIPNAAAVLGTAIGSIWMGVLVARRGQRSALRLMYGLAVLGGLIGF